MAQESVLVITVDARNAENRIKAVNSALSSLERSGESASDSIRDVGQNADKETTRLDKFKTSITNLAAESKLYFAGVAGAAVGATGALVALAVQTANTAAEIERLSYLSGATTTEFQEFAVGAKAMGIEMDKLSDIFKDVQDRVGDFITTGGGELSDFFTEIATKTEGSADGALELAKSMRELSGPEALQLYVSKLEEAGVAQSEMVFFMESVADEATALIPLLENGGEGLDLWAEAARNAGAIMDNETLAAAQRLKVETQLLEMQMTGLKNQFMSGLFPALNQIASAFTGTTDQTFNLKSAAEGVGNTLIWLTKIGMGVAATFEIAGKVIGGTIAALSSKEVTHQMVLDDIGNSLNDIGKRYEKLNNPNINNKLVDSLTQVQIRANENAASVAKAQVNTKKMQETFDKAAGSAAKVKDNTKQLAREAERAADEVRRIMYEYSSEESQKAIDLQKEIARLQQYGQEQYISIARTRYEEERKLAKMNFEYDLVEFRVSEEQKLRFLYNIKEQEVIADTKLTKEQTQQKLASLKIQFQQEMYDIKLAKDQRLFAATEFQYSEMERIQKRYELERRELGKIHDEKERAALQEASRQRQIKEESEARIKITADYNQATGNDPFAQLTKERDDRQEAIDEMYKSKLITQEQYQNDSLASQRKYEFAKLDMNLGYGQDILGSLSQMYGSMRGEQSKGFKVLFAAEKAFAIARASIALGENISRASSIGFPQNLPLIAGAVAQGAMIFSNIKAISDVGFETGGYTGNMGTKTVAGVVHGQEYVLNAKATKKIGVGNLDALNSGADFNSGQPVNVIINTPQGYTANTRKDGNNLTVDIVEQMIDQKFDNVRKPNSRESRIMQTSFGLQPAR